MFLRSLEVRKFRGIVSGRLDLDETTLLIGENDCGKSSLLAAIAVALAGPPEAPPRIERHHFHHPADPAQPPQGPVRIELEFAERSAGEWDVEAARPLAPLLPSAPTGNRVLRLVVEAGLPEDDGPPQVHWRVVSPGRNGGESRNDVTHLAAIRRMSPMVWLRSGMLLGETSPEPAGRAAAAPGGELAELSAEVEAHYQALLSGTSANELEELKAGYEAARELLRRRAEEYHSAGSLTHTPVAEVLGRRAVVDRPAGLAFHGSAAQQIGVLIVTGAIIRHGLGQWAPGTVPLLVVEDPEAHLHLMTLASVWGLLEHARAQKLVSTQSETLLAAAPLAVIRRLTRFGGTLRQWRVRPDALGSEELRKLSYHVRARRGEAMFARCWLLVEGETEFWMLPELARQCGYDLNLEGVAVVEFAQCGLAPLIKLAREMGIEWHVLTDGDSTGRDYADEARRFAGGEADWRITRLRERDLENCFWRHGYEEVYLKAAGLHFAPGHKIAGHRVIRRAIKRHSKPYLAFEALAAVTRKDSSGVPGPLRHVVDICVQLAREAPERAGSGEPRGPRRKRRPRQRRSGT
jgi:putative ATP-dependent endonuclease of OLD family